MRLAPLPVVLVATLMLFSSLDTAEAQRGKGGGGGRGNAGGNRGGANVQSQPRGQGGGQAHPGGPQSGPRGGNPGAHAGGNVDVGAGAKVDAPNAPGGGGPRGSVAPTDRPGAPDQRNIQSRSIEPRSTDLQRGPDPQRDADRQRDMQRRNFDSNARRGDFARDGGRNNFHPNNLTPRHSFYRGGWNGGNAQALRNMNRAAALGISPNAFGFPGFGYNNYAYRGSGGNNTLSTLLRLGLALTGNGSGYGLGGYGGYGLGGLGGFPGYGGYGGYGLNSWGGYPLGWGLGGGGLGSLAYLSGYLPYSNPYYDIGWGGYNYAQPIRVGLAVNDNPSASQLFDMAVAQFKAGDYQTSLNTVDQAIAQNPTDPVMHEFRALALFATHNYPAAAATIHSVLAVGPGWNWDTLSALYPDVNAYTAQLRALEQATVQNPNQADIKFLLAYHYLTTGHSDAASQELAEVTRLKPDDRLAADLLKMNQVGQTAQADPNAQPQERPNQAQPGDAGQQAVAATQPQAPAAQAAQAKPVDPQELVGDWHAQRSDGSSFELKLNDDKTFVWNVDQNGKSQKLEGTYDVQQNVLALQSPQAGAMVAEVEKTADDQFRFKLLGAPQADQGLAFNR